MEGLFWESLLKSFLPPKKTAKYVCINKPLFSYSILKSWFHLEAKQYLLLGRGNCFQSSFTSKWVKICSRYYLTSRKSWNNLIRIGNNWNYLLISFWKNVFVFWEKYDFNALNTRFNDLIKIFFPRVRAHTHTSCLVGPTKPVKEKEGDDVIKPSRCITSAADPGDVACGEHLAAFTTREPLHVGGKGV